MLNESVVSLIGKLRLRNKFDSQIEEMRQSGEYGEHLARQELKQCVSARSWLDEEIEEEVNGLREEAEYHRESERKRREKEKQE